MEGEAPDSSPLTLEEEFEGCIYSQDEGDDRFQATGTKKKSIQSHNSPKYCTVEEFTKKYPGCFSMEYPMDIFEGVEHSVSSTNVSIKDTLLPVTVSSLSVEQNQCNTAENGPPLQHDNLQLYSHEKIHEGQESIHTLSVTHEGTLNESMSCAFTEANAAFGFQYNSCHSNENTYAEEISVDEAVYESEQNHESQCVAMEEKILDTSDWKLPRNLKQSTESKLGETKEMLDLKLCQKPYNKVFKKKISPKKILENCIQMSKDMFFKRDVHNIHHNYQTLPSHDVRVGLLGQLATNQSGTPHNESTPSPRPGCSRRRSAPPSFNLLESNSPATLCSVPMPSNFGTVEESLPYQSTDDNWQVSWNTDSEHCKNVTDSTWIISEISGHEARPAKCSSSPKSLNTSLLGMCKREPGEKSTYLSWRKAPRRSLDWPPSSSTSCEASKQPSKYLNVSPHSWRAAPGTSLDWPSNQTGSKSYRIKAVFDEKELQVKSYAPGFIDTHCHLDFLFERNRHNGTYSKFRQVAKDPFPVSYEGCVTIFCKPWTFKKISWWEEIIMEPGIWAAFGCHPHYADQYGDEAEAYLEVALLNSKTVALGEIGLDYYKNNPDQYQTQREVFRRQLKIALRMKKPVIIHCRDAHRDCIDIIKEILPLNYQIHLHCFTGSWKIAEEWLETFSGLFMGITNLINNHKDLRSFQLQMAVKKIPLQRLLLETDTPFFRPAFLQEGGQHSHPGMALYVAAQVAHLKGKEVQVVLAYTRHNTKLMYGI